MTRARNVFGLLAVLVLVGWLGAADDKKAGDEPKPAPRAKGQLPPGFRKLGLTDLQIQKIYKIQSDYRGKIDELETKIRELRQQQRAEQYQVLTEAQKARLKELGTERYNGDVPKKEPAKVSDDKKTDKDKNKKP